MPAKPTDSPEFETDALGHLACPACHGYLRMDDARMVCLACHRAYPIVDSIPVLIVERAETITGR